MNARETLERLLAAESLTRDEAMAVMQSLLSGELDAEWIAGALVALRMKGETPDEIAGFATAMRAHATAVPCESSPLIDTCGTGGDGTQTFNISTAAAFVVAAAGGHVAKHGNRSVSSQCGSADVLEALGANLSLSPAEVGRCVDEIGVGFLFAPALHGAMKHAVGPRKALGVRTAFNILGPLTNPAGAHHQVMGVYDPALLDLVAQVMVRLGNGRSLVVHGNDGLDELTVTESTQVRLVDGDVSVLEISPESAGVERHPAAALRGGDAATNAGIIRDLLSGTAGAPRDVVVLNAGAALWVGGLSPDLTSGVERARQAIDSGRTRSTLESFVKFTQEHGSDA